MKRHAAGLLFLLAVVAVLAWTLTRPAGDASLAAGEATENPDGMGPDLVGVGELLGTVEDAPVSSERQPVGDEGPVPEQTGGAGNDPFEARTFQVAGNLIIDPELAALASPELSVFRSIGSDWIEMARSSLQPGEWDPVEIELTGARWFKVRLDGSHLIADEQVFAAPRPDEVTYHEFVAQRGAEQWYLVTDTSEQPIEGARVDARWKVGERWVGTHGITGETGHVLINGIRPGAVYARASCTGYSPQGIEPSLVPEVPPVAWEFNLQPASTIRGVCLQDGDPVEDFTVAFWHADWYSIGPQRRAFTGREEGSFEIDEVPLGSVFLVASSHDAPGSEPVALRVDEEGRDGVEIHLRRGSIGTGVVVDGETGEPVTNAKVQCFVRGTRGAAMRWREPIPVDAGGRFQVESVLPGENHLQIHAAGYATAEAELNVTEGGRADFGEIRLVRPVELNVILRGADLESVNGFQVWGEGAKSIPITRFELQAKGVGLARITDVSPGRYTLKLWRPEGVMDAAQVLYEAGRSYEQAFLASGGGSLRIDFLDEPPPPKTSVILIWPDGEGLDTRRAFWVTEETTTVDVLQSGPVRIEVRTGGSDLIASQVADIREGHTARVAFRLGADRRRVRIEDAEGEPVPGVEVLMRSRDDPLAPRFSGETDATGLAEVGAVPAGSYTVYLSHGSGSRYNVPIEVRANQDEAIVFTLDPRASLSLQFLDGDTPVPGVAFHPVDTHGTRLGWISMNADAEGRHELKNLGPGTVRLATRDSRVWPAVAEFAVDAGTVPATFHVRRLGDLVIEVRNTDAVAVSGVALELQFEDGEVVADWIAAGRVGAAASDLVTNTKGQVEITGLPRGLYSWRTARDGEELTGSFEVVASETTTATIVVP